MVATSGTQNGARWRLAPCLVHLFLEADHRDPTRDDSSDGSIGDADHQSRPSDHNPVDGWVTASDIDDDQDEPSPGVHLLRAHLTASQDSRVKYLIHEGTIWKAYPNRGLPAWTPQPYTGFNAHKQHLHISVWNTPEARNDIGPWWPDGDDDMSEITDALNRIELRVIALETKLNSTYDKIVDEVTVREDIRLTREIAKTVGVPPSP